MVQMTIGVAGVLAVCTWTDCRWQKIWMPLVLGMTPYILYFRIYGKKEIWASALAGMVVLVFFCSMSMLTEGQIGKADGILLGETMLALDVWQGVGFLMYCMTYAFLAALVLVIFFHKKKDARMPFAPFIFLGYLTAVAVS